MNFDLFVDLYWGKRRRSGAPWTPETIAEDSGFSLSDVNTLLAWCHTQGTLTDDALKALFDSQWSIVQTPFGIHLQRKVVTTPGTVAELKAKIQEVLDATN